MHVFEVEVLVDLHDDDRAEVAVSAHDGHADDKSKEWAARGLALRWVRFGLVCGDVLPIREERIKEQEKKKTTPSKKDRQEQK